MAHTPTSEQNKVREPREMKMHRVVFFLAAVCASMSSAAVADDVRRVVTGLDDKNHAVVLFDSRIPLKQDSPVISSTNFWITDSTPPSLSSQDPANRPIGVSPPDNGTKFRLVEFGPLSPEVEAKLPPEMIMKGVSHPPAKGIPVKHPMMHRTRSLDYAVILSGEIDMMLDDTSVHLKQGDVIVQQATNHGWVNHGTQPCRILFVLMDSKEP
jgi:mannose-6-phosphate isomerase-like protein (cupin superfamily)